MWGRVSSLVEMIRGSHPFLRPNKGAMTFAMLNQPPAGLEILPDAVRAGAYRALSKKPERRYSGADEMLRDLEAALSEFMSSPAPAEEPTLTHSVSARELKQYMENASTPSWTVGNSGKARRFLLASIGVVLAAIAVSFLPPVRERFPCLPYSVSETHITVLPFANTGNEPGYDP